MLFGDLAISICTACIASDLMLVVLFSRPYEWIVNLHRRVYLPIVVIAPMLLIFVPYLLTDGKGPRFYGDAKLWCWISEDFVLYRFYLFYILLWIIFLFNLIIFLLVGRKVWKRANTVKRYVSTARAGLGQVRGSPELTESGQTPRQKTAMRLMSPTLISSRLPSAIG
jgi:hypothetical protein